MRLPPRIFVLAFFSLQLAVRTLCQSQSTIASFEDPACSTPEYNMFPQSINFDVTKHECLLIRDDTLKPIVDSFDAVFYASAEDCRAGNPIVVNYSSSILPVTPMPLFSSPVSNQNLTFCFDSVRNYNSFSSTSSRALSWAIRDVPGVRSRLGLVGGINFFLCPVSNSGVFSQQDQQSANHPVVLARSFVMHQGPLVSFGLRLFLTNNSKLVPLPNFLSEGAQSCVAGSCCTTGYGTTTIHFKVSNTLYKTPTKAYGKVLSCNAGNLMFQTYRDDKCTEGKNVPSVLKADGSCQRTPTPSRTEDSDRYGYEYGYGTYYKGRCEGPGARPPATAPSVSVSAFFDSSCSQPNVDVMPSPINCDASKCCLIAKRSGVNFLEGGAVHLFASAADCQNNVTAHPTNMSADIVSINSGQQTRLNISGFPFGFWMPPSTFHRCVDQCNIMFPRQNGMNHPSLSQCQCPLYPFTTDGQYFSRIFPRKPRLILCFHNNPQDMKNLFFLGYFAQYLGDGKWSFDIRMFSDGDCKQQIFIDAFTPSDRLCATDTCCRVGNSTASFHFRIPSSLLVFENNKNDLYGRLLSCDGDVAMFHQFEDSACSAYSSQDFNAMLPRVMRADGSCSAVPTSAYAIDSFYTAKCNSPTPLVESVSVTAFSDSSCSSPSTSVQPQAVTCPVNRCCLVRQGTGSQAPIYGRALSCNPQVLLFNTYADSQCITPNQYMPLVLQSDGSCQVDQTGYTSFYRASCKMLPTPPAAPPSATPILPCPKDLQGNVCGGSEFGTCSQVILASGVRLATCVCVSGKGFFNGQICISAASHSEVAGRTNKTFMQQQQQANLLQALSCSDPNNPVKCPSAAWVASLKHGQCQTSMAACAASAADFRIYLENQAKTCSGNTTFDNVLLQCIASEAPPTPIFACPANMMRCSDGSCRATCSAVQAPVCPSGSTGSFLCPGNQVICSMSLSECSRNQPWNGCPVNRIQCPNRPGICVATLQDCTLAPGPFSCPDPALPAWCGSLRDAQGKLILDTDAKAQSKCVAQSAASSCPPIPNLAAKAIPKVQSIIANSAAAISALGSDNTPIATLDIPANTVSDVSFVVSPVPDSVYQSGAFAALFSAGKLRSPLISISPDAIVDTRSGGITLTLAVDVPADLCVNVTSYMQGFAVSEASAGDMSFTPDPMSPCTGVVQNGLCKCSFVVSHFSTFAVGDAVTPDATATPKSSASAVASPNIGAIAGGIVGGILLIAIVSFLIMKAKNRNTVVSSDSATQKPVATEMDQIGVVAAATPPKPSITPGPPQYGNNMATELQMQQQQMP